MITNRQRTKDLLKIMPFFSGGASSVKYILENDRNLNVKYRIVGSFTDNKNASAINFLKEKTGLEPLCLDIFDWYQKKNKKITDLGERVNYFRKVLELISPLEPDLIMLSGFMRIVTEPLLTEFENRILNVHPADLTILDENGHRKYTGMNAVEKAFIAEEKSTRSTVHIVSAEVDGGEIIALSDPLLIEPGVDPKTHQEKMKFTCDGPAYLKALDIMIDRLR